MTVLAVVHPTDLVASDLREALDRHPELWDEIRLLAAFPEEVGVLTQTGGQAAVVSAIDDDSLVGVDVAIFCGRIEVLRPFFEKLPTPTRALVIARDATAQDGYPVVVGVSHENLPTDRPLLSPHPGVVALAHLIHPLRALGPQRAVATLVQPISAIYGAGGFDALFEQTRDLLAFQPVNTELLPRQFAFNLLHADDTTAGIEAHLGQVLGRELPISVQLLRGGIFHGLSISLHLELAPTASLQQVLDALGEHPLLDFVEDGAMLGATDAAGREEVLIGRVEVDSSRPGCFKIWAVMDNLSRGGALNALGILEALHSPMVS